MKTILIAFLTALILSLVTGKICLPILRKIKAGQPILKYVETHKDKNGTPTMGGLFFIMSALIVFLIVCGFENRIALVCAVIGLAFMIVGFLDDFIKVKFKKNEGLKPYQKIIFQIVISIFAGVFVYHNGITVFYIPFTKNAVNLGCFTIVVVALIFIAITNSVNLTDGLDGLASGVSIIYLIGVSLLIGIQTVKFNHLYLQLEEFFAMQVLCGCTIGALCGFLVFNANKAKVFMGDTGSLSLGGLLGAISVFSSNSFFIPIIGIMFVLSSISVIVQVAYFKLTKKRVFLMAPLHHHFQLKGYTETQISYCYSLVTAVMVIVCVIFYL